MDKGMEEIRINDLYASRIKSTYKTGNKDGESAPNIRMANLRTDTYIDKIVDKINPSQKNTMLPENCRFIKQYGHYTIVVIEEAPAMRSIRVNMDLSRDAEALRGKGQWETFGYKDFFKENNKPYTFMLAMPYVIHVLLLKGNNEFSRGRVYFRPKPLLGMSDVLYRPPLLNTSGNMGVCYGDAVYKGPKSGIAKEAEHAQKVFWAAEFNPDYIENYNEYSETAGLCDYFTWQYYSQQNPMFVYTADWILYHKPIDEVIRNIEHNNRLDRAMIGYKTFTDIFSSPTVSDKKVKVGSRKAERRLVYDVCNGWYPERDLPTFIGDPLPYSKDRIAYLDSFIGIEGYSDPKYVRLLVDNKRPVLKLNKKVKEFFASKIKELRYESCIELPDGTKIEPGDILCVPTTFGSTVFKKVHYIRKAMDDRVELRIGSEFWFADAFEWDKVSKVDITAPEIDGVKINNKDEYKFFNHSYNPPAPIGRFSNVKFTEVNTGTNGRLIAKFEETDGDRRSMSISLTENTRGKQKVLPASDLEQVPKIFFTGRSLISCVDGSSRSKPPQRHKDFGLTISPYHKLNFRQQLLDIEQTFLNKDRTKFHAESNNMKIDFSVGDKVIVADWANPLNMLNIKTIQSFVSNSGNSCLDFALTDKHGNISKVTYVDGYNSVFNVGKIRKVTNELNGVTIGTKIISKEAGIQCFPKKDVNIIVAFIVDTDGEPLVLCSNGCTLWFNDMMEKFDVIAITSKRWKKLVHAPLDPSKIKLQPGDVVNGTRQYHCRRGYIVTRNRGGSGMRLIALEYYHEFDEYYSSTKDFLNDIVLDCIPNPRLSLPKQKEQGYISGFPTFHGGVTVTNVNFSPYKFLDETGRF